MAPMMGTPLLAGVRPIASHPASVKLTLRLFFAVGVQQSFAHQRIDMLADRRGEGVTEVDGHLGSTGLSPLVLRVGEVVKDLRLLGR